MLALALVSAAVASGTALTKPAENPLRRLSESDPSGGAGLVWRCLSEKELLRKTRSLQHRRT